MNKRDKILFLLELVKQQAEEFLECEPIMHTDLAPEEIIIASVECILNHQEEQEHIPVSTQMPIATVDRAGASFFIGDDFDIPITGVADDN